MKQYFVRNNSGLSQVVPGRKRSRIPVGGEVGPYLASQIDLRACNGSPHFGIRVVKVAESDEKEIPTDEKEIPQPIPSGLEKPTEVESIMAPPVKAVVKDAKLEPEALKPVEEPGMDAVESPEKRGRKAKGESKRGRKKTEDKPAQ